MALDPLDDSEGTDKSRFIRTFAKDMAALSGSATATTPAPTSPAAPPKKKEEREEVDGVSLPKTEQPFFSKPPEHEAPKRTIEELPSMQEAQSIVSSAPRPTPVPFTPAPITSHVAPAAHISLADTIREMGEGIMESIPAPTPKPLPPIEPVTLPTKPAPVSSIPLTPVAPPPAPADPERESLLARLREKVAAHAEEDKRKREEEARIPVAPTPPAPVPEVRPEPVRVRPSPVLPPTPPAPPPAPPIPVSPKKPSPFHSYSTDFSDRVSNQGATAFSVIAAEQDARPRVQVSTHRSRGMLYVVLAIVFILLTASGGYGAYVYVSHLPAKPVALFSVPSLVVFDTSKNLGSIGAAPAAFEQLLAQPLPENSLAVAYVPELATSSTNGAPLVSALLPDAPDIVLRNIDPASTVGAVSIAGDSRAFFVLRVTSYERTFAGMLSWESRMAQDLNAFYPAVPDAPVDMGTSTPLTQQQTFTFTPVFTDAIVDNHDVRVFKDARGNTIMLYGYVNKATLIIARNEAAFSLLVSHLK